jgi:hypothetical protein
VRTHPNDEEHLVVVVDRNDQPVVVPLDVEDDTFGRNDACRAVLCFQLCRTLPGGLGGFGLPGIKMILYRLLELTIHPVSDKTV